MYYRLGNTAQHAFADDRAAAVHDFGKSVRNQDIQRGSNHPH